MDMLIAKLDIYIIPPVLSLAIGLSLAILSLVKGKFRKENILFSMVCFWWSCLLAPAFIAHHLFRGEEELILTIERVIHFFFVYIPLVNMVYLTNVLKLQRKSLIVLTAVISFAISLFTPTHYYFTGLYTYSWGYIAKGNIVFNIFSAYGMIVIAYLAFEGFRKLRTETNYIMRIKIKYIVFSLLASAVLTLFNIPAINGIDFYPLGNLNFIPLAILAYGVLRFRLMDIRSILHITVVWGVVSSLIIIPNIFLLMYFWPIIIRLGINQVMLIAICWFLVNYLYMRKVQPFIDQLFNKRKYNLQLVESQFVENVAHLKSYDDLVREFTDILRKTLSFTDFYIIRRNEESGNYVLKSDESLNLSNDIQSWFLKNNDLMNKSLVETDPLYSPVRNELSGIFSRLNCEFILPFIHNEKIIGIMIMPERANLQQLTLDEMRFVNNLKNSVLIALLNSLMYQDLTNYKNNLELMVTERTGQLRQSEAQMLIKDKAIEKSINGIVITDIKGNISYVNNAFYMMWGGVSPDEVIGKPISDFIHSKNVAREIYSAGINSGKWFGELIVKKRDGSVFDVQGSMNTITDPDINATHIVHSFIDITDRKNAERELKKYHVQLEMRVIERTKELESLNRANIREIEERKQAENLLLQKEKDLIEKSQELLEMNTALKVLLKQGEQDKENIANDIFSNVKKNILPNLKRLQDSSTMNRKDKESIAAIETEINDIVSPFFRNLSNQYSQFTPSEIKVANLIKNGKSTKEISDLLNISAQGVEFHRNNIREKLGLINKKVNLRSFLLSLS